MWYPAEFAIESYLPDELEVGMLFTNRISVGVIDPYIELFELEEIPEDPDAFMAKNGAPVKIIIVDDEANVIATHDEIGWWDDGDDTDEYREVTLDDINYLFRELEGYVDIEIGGYGVFLVEGKVVLTLIGEDYYDYADPDEIWDETLNNELEEE